MITMAYDTMHALFVIGSAEELNTQKPENMIINSFVSARVCGVDLSVVRRDSQCSLQEVS